MFHLTWDGKISLYSLYRVFLDRYQVMYHFKQCIVSQVVQCHWRGLQEFMQVKMNTGIQPFLLCFHWLLFWVRLQWCITLSILWYSFKNSESTVLQTSNEKHFVWNFHNFLAFICLHNRFYQNNKTYINATECKRKKKKRYDHNKRLTEILKFTPKFCLPV